MIQLVNLSNDPIHNQMINHSASYLESFLKRHRLDGIEMLFCAPLDDTLHPQRLIRGAHLRYWPCWLDLWRNDRDSLIKEFHNEKNIFAYYGGLTRETWLDQYRDNTRMAVASGARYLVFHVSHARTQELFTLKFNASSREVIDGTIEVMNQLIQDIPPEMTLLFENLWQPGLTLHDLELIELLLQKVNHPNIGIMLDTGHLMSTNPHLRSEAEGIAYILKTIELLGDYKSFIKGIHLNCSLPGNYLVGRTNQTAVDYSSAEVTRRVLEIDQHLPFHLSETQRIIDLIEPEYLVHEFIFTSMADWDQKVRIQRKALSL